MNLYCSLPIFCCSAVLLVWAIWKSIRHLRALGKCASLTFVSQPGDLTLHLAARRAWWGEQEISLTRLEFDLLVSLFGSELWSGGELR